MGTRIDRRQFLKSAAAAGTAATVGVTLAGCQAQAESSLPAKWDKETDVLVIGFGLAGASTALAAREAGAEVLLIEKMDEEHSGGNSKLSGNMLFVPGNAEDGGAYFRGMCADHMYGIDDEMVKVWIDGMLENRTWIDENLGVQLFPVPAEYGMGPELPALPGAETMQIYMVNGQMGNGALFTPVRDLVLAADIDILYNTAAYKLLIDDQKRVVGAMADSDGATIAIKAKRGVVLTCGSFEFNEAMKASFLQGPMYGMGTIGNTGDGIIMAQELGAELWHMNNAMGPMSPLFMSSDLDYPQAGMIAGASTPAYFYADKYGKRFMNENRPHAHGKGWDVIHDYDGVKGEFPQNPWWVVFDQASIDGGPVGSFNSEVAAMKMGWSCWHSSYVWSMDNSEELSKGWIKQGKTIEELAEETGMDTETLQATVEKFNTYADAGLDDDYGRVNMAALEGPFYAIQVHPGMVNTQGGPRRNARAQVMHVDGNPIARLYSAGECGAIYSWQYQGGGNLGECLCFGRIAGTNAASEEAI